MIKEDNYRDQEFLDKIALRISIIMEVKGIGPTKLSNLIECEPRQLRRVLMAEHNYSVSEISRIAKGLGVKPKDILDFDSDFKSSKQNTQKNNE